MIKNPFLKLKLEMISPQFGADMIQIQTEGRGNANRKFFSTWWACFLCLIPTGGSYLTHSGGSVVLYCSPAGAGLSPS